MKLSLFGVGNAGTRLVDELLQTEVDTGRNFTDGNVLAFNTAAAAFSETTALPEERQVLIGDTHSEVNQYVGPTADPEADAEADDTEIDDDTPLGVDGDAELGATVASDELPEIRRALDLVDDTEVDAAMVVVGLGGGTATGVGSVLLEELQAVYEIPVYVLGVLPATTESDRRAWTAARAVRTMVPLADAVLTVDNEAWREHNKPLAEQYDRINGEIATRIRSLFAAGESDPATVSEMRIDPADMMRTLDVGGLSAISHTSIEVDTNDESFLDRLLQLLGLAEETPDKQTDAATIKRLVRRTLESKLTVPADIESTDRVLLILSGPPKDISRKGFETGRYLLEQETGTVEVLAGDEPLPNAEEITATVLFSNVTEVPRIDEMQQRAVAYQDEHAADSEITETATATDASTAIGTSTAPDEEAAADGADAGEADGADAEEADAAETEPEATADSDHDFEFHGDTDELSENGEPDDHEGNGDATDGEPADEAENGAAKGDGDDATTETDDSDTDAASDADSDDADETEPTAAEDRE